MDFLYIEIVFLQDFVSFSLTHYYSIFKLDYQIQPFEFFTLFFHMFFKKSWKQLWMLGSVFLIQIIPNHSSNPILWNLL